MKALNLENMRYGRLTVLELVRDDKNARRWRCVCDCGKEHTATSQALQAGSVQSCGCLRRETTSTTGKASRRHGYCSGGKVAPEWKSWYAMRSRCTRTYDVAYGAYAGKGIEVCERWLHSFENFLADMGPKPKDGKRYSIDRIDNTKGYFPENCRWATYLQQNNNRTCCIQITSQGVTLTVSQWAKKLGVCFGTVRIACLKYGDDLGIQELQKRYGDLVTP
jgi:hypothetical protein